MNFIFVLFSVFFLFIGPQSSFAETKVANLSINIESNNKNFKKCLRSEALQSCTLFATTSSSGCAQGILSVTNNSRINALNISASSSNPNFTNFVIQNNACPSALAPGASCSITFHTTIPATFTIPDVAVRGTNTNTTFFNLQAYECVYTVGGTVSGLTGTVVLENNGGDALPLNANGSFVFPTPLAPGTPYSVTVASQPVGQTCIVTNGTGVITNANVTNVAVDCFTNTTLTTSIADLALSVTGLTEYGVPGTPASGVPRIITITNTGGATAINLVVTPPIWPTGTTNSTTCGSTLGAGNSCTITVTPGPNPTSDCSTLISPPTPGIVQVGASNSNTVTTNVVILSYACIYQGGYIFAMDDTPPTSTSIGGKSATTTNQSGGIIWSSNSAGTFDGGVAIYAINETSTTATPSPNVGQVPGQVNCNGNIDGSCDTNNIFVYYQTAAVGAPINTSFYAAGLCKQTISGFSDWYLPSICETGYQTGGSAGFRVWHCCHSNVAKYAIEFV